MYFIYILKCRNNTYYTGYTTDLQRRYQEHQQGSTKCKYTRSFPPIAIVACWQFTDLSATLKIENAIKRLSRQRKQVLIDKPQSLLTFINRSKKERNIQLSDAIFQVYKGVNAFKK